MLSKVNLTLVALALCFSGCSLRLNDTVTKPQTSVNTGSGCLSKAGDVMDRFERGTLDATEHDSFYGCVNTALSTFMQSVDGKNKEYFEPGELSGFLTKYFLDGKVIQNGLMQEAMSLKVAIVGGTSEKLTRADLSRILQIFASLQRFTGDLRPIMPLKAASFVERGFDSERFAAAMKTFVSASSEFGSTLQGEQGSYQFAHLEALVKELKIFLYNDQVPEDHWLNTAQRLAIALPPAKAIMISPPRNEITHQDWPKIFRLAPRYYASYLRVQFYMNAPFSTLYGGGLQTIEKLFNEFLGIFDYVLEQHPNQVITSDEIDDLVRTFSEQKLIDCRPDTARQFIKALFGKLLGGFGEGDRTREKFEITKESLSHVKRAARFGLEGLHAAEAMYRTKFNDKFLEGSLTREEIAAVPSTFLMESTTLRNDLSLEAVETLKRTPFDIRTVFSNNTFGVVIPKVGQTNSYSYMYMLKMVGLRAVNRLVIDSYGDARASKLSEAQLDSFLGDMFPLMIELRLTSESLKASISKRLFEASLFLYSSDGDRGLTMNEALELEAIVLSTLENAPRVHKFLGSVCSETKTDKNGDTLIPASCYRAEFVRNAKETWSYLPGLADYVGALSSEEQLVLFDRMSRFLRKDAKETDDFTLSDSQAFVLLPYYVELLFSRFDANNDGVLDNKEAEAAYPVFRPFIAEKAAAKGYTKPADHTAIFNFIMSRRELPTDATFSYAIRRYLLGAEKFRVNRGHVVEIFSKLMAM